MHDARPSDARAYTAEVWRIVEAQNKSSTMRITDNLDDQALLEELIDEAKPPVSADCRHLNFLLSTPFRYVPYPDSSRFRRANSYPGVFYAAETQVTAVAELAFYRMLFFSEAPGMTLPAHPAEHRAFAVPCVTDRCFDLTEPPFDAHREAWTDRMDHSACHALADKARSFGVQVIRYESVREAGGRCVAILDPVAFARPEPTRLETWRLYVRPMKVQAQREFPPMSREFELADFADDPRVADLLKMRATAT